MFSGCISGDMEQYSKIVLEMVSSAFKNRIAMDLHPTLFDLGESSMGFSEIIFEGSFSRHQKFCTPVAESFLLFVCHLPLLLNFPD